VIGTASTGAVSVAKIQNNYAVFDSGTTNISIGGDYENVVLAF